jgi:hypothetical protein
MSSAMMTTKFGREPEVGDGVGVGLAPLPQAELESRSPRAETTAVTWVQPRGTASVSLVSGTGDERARRRALVRRRAKIAPGD